MSTEAHSKHAPAVALLAEFLKANGIAQSAAAEALGVSRIAVSYWLSGTHRPSMAMRAAIEKWTSKGVPASAWLFAGEVLVSGRVKPFRKRAA